MLHYLSEEGDILKKSIISYKKKEKETCTVKG